MTSLKSIQREIKSHQKNGLTNHAIALIKKIDQSEIKRILSGKYPGESVAARLGLPVKCSRCHRRIPAKQAVREPIPEYIKQFNALPKARRWKMIKELMTPVSILTL